MYSLLTFAGLKGLDGHGNLGDCVYFSYLRVLNFKLAEKQSFNGKIKAT